MNRVPISVLDLSPISEGIVFRARRPVAIERDSSRVMELEGKFGKVRLKS
jgi:hypothetical protein